MDSLRRGRPAAGLNGRSWEMVRRATRRHKAEKRKAGRHKAGRHKAERHVGTRHTVGAVVLAGENVPK